MSTNSNDNDLKIALITGASRGIGAATARLAAEAGYDVCINYASDAAAAEAVAKDCRAKGVRAEIVKADVAGAGDVARMFAFCDEKLGAPTLVVNNAGVIGGATPLANLKHDALERTYAVNVFGTIYCCQEAIRRMARSAGGKGGVIVNISSIAAVLGSPGEYVHYASSKGAIETLTVGLAKEVGPDGVRVNAIRVGTTDTEMHSKGGNPDRPAKIAQIAPLRRVAVPRDIAEAIVWIGSDKASYATGAVLSISGGMA